MVEGFGDAKIAFRDPKESADSHLKNSALVRRAQRRHLPGYAKLRHVAHGDGIWQRDRAVRSSKLRRSINSP